MTAIEITCRPVTGILAVSVDTITALDALAEQLHGHLKALAATVPAGTPWQIDVAIGRTAADTVHLTAAPATEPTPEEDDAA